MKIYVDKVNKVGVFDVQNDKPVLANHVLLNEYLPGWSMKRLSNVYLNFDFVRSRNYASS